MNCKFCKSDNCGPFCELIKMTDELLDESYLIEDVVSQISSNERVGHVLVEKCEYGYSMVVYDVEGMVIINGHGKNGSLADAAKDALEKYQKWNL